MLNPSEFDRNMDTPKKIRAKNFDEMERNILLQLTSLDAVRTIIENKATDYVTNSNKTKAWEEITKKFNTLSRINLRSVDQLRTCYKNLKKKRRSSTKSETNINWKLEEGLINNTDVSKMLEVYGNRQIHPNYIVFSNGIKENESINLTEDEIDLSTESSNENNVNGLKIEPENNIINAIQENIRTNNIQNHKRLHENGRLNEKLILMKSDYNAKLELYGLEKKLKKEFHEKEIVMKEKLFDLDMKIRETELEIKRTELLIKQKTLKNLKEH